MSEQLKATLHCWPQLLILGAMIIHFSRIIEARKIVRGILIAGGNSGFGCNLWAIKEIGKVAIVQFVVYSGGFWDPLIGLLHR